MSEDALHNMFLADIVVKPIGDVEAETRNYVRVLGAAPWEDHEYYETLAAKFVKILDEYPKGLQLGVGDLKEPPLRKILEILGDDDDVGAEGPLPLVLSIMRDEGLLNTDLGWPVPDDHEGRKLFFKDIFKTTEVRATDHVRAFVECYALLILAKENSQTARLFAEALRRASLGARERLRGMRAAKIAEIEDEARMLSPEFVRAAEDRELREKEERSGLITSLRRRLSKLEDTLLDLDKAVATRLGTLEDALANPDPPTKSLALEKLVDQLNKKHGASSTKPKPAVFAGISFGFGDGRGGVREPRSARGGKKSRKLRKRTTLKGGKRKRRRTRRRR
jgi:hypothetical protein